MFEFDITKVSLFQEGIRSGDKVGMEAGVSEERACNTRNRPFTHLIRRMGD